jgi:hypothetical protein
VVVRRFLAAVEVLCSHFNDAVETEDPRRPSCGCLAITREQPQSVRIRVLTVVSGVFDKFSDRIHNKLLEMRQCFADVPRTLAPQLETAYFTEENALSARKHDLLSVL